MRLPNGFGSVYKLSGKRRRPWIARITTGWEIVDGKEKQVIATLGYYETRADAINALSSYNMDPYDLRKRKLTLTQVYEMWFEEFKAKVSESTQRSYIAAYKYTSPISDLAMSDLTVNHLEKAIHESGAGDATKYMIMTLFNKLYKYAMKHDIVTKDVAALCDSVPKAEPKIVRIPFSDDEIKTLWDCSDLPIVSMVLYGIYSGWRPQELAKMKLDHVDFDNMVVTFGMKTKSGNRVVPIHSKVQELVKRNYARAQELGSEYLFNTPDKDGVISNMNYTQYKNKFYDLMEQLNMDHYPHDTRHTFVTMGKHAKMDDYILKLITGHKIDDITEATYTHRELYELKEEIEKIK